MSKESYSSRSRANDAIATLMAYGAAGSLVGIAACPDNKAAAAQERPAEPQPKDSWIDGIEIRRAAEQVPTQDRGA